MRYRSVATQNHPAHHFDPVALREINEEGEISNFVAE